MTPKPRKMCLLAMVMLIVSLSPKVRPETTFTKEAPILWTETNEQWTTGSYELTLTLQLETPCRYLQQNKILWCESEFDGKLFQPLQDLCMEHGRPFENTVKRRAKRWLKKVLDFVGTVILGLTSQLLSSDIGKSDSVLNEDKKRVSELQKGIRFMDQKIFSLDQEMKESNANFTVLLVKQKEQFGRNNGAVKKIKKENRILEKQLNKNEKDLQRTKKEMSEEVKKLNVAMTSLNEDMTEWRKNMDDTLSDKIKEISNFVSYFDKLQTQMKAFTRNWLNGSLSDEFFDILMMANNDTIVNF